MTSPAKNQPGAAAQVAVLLDGQRRCVPTGATLADLVGQLGHAPEGVSTALNGQFVPRAERAARALAEGDAVLLFQPIVGG